MKLFLLLPIEEWEPWYDSAFGFVVRAHDEGPSRTIASERAGNEGPAVWLDPACTTCVELTAVGPPGIILRDFAAA